MNSGRAYSHFRQMHQAIDPAGREVYCDFADDRAWTNSGFCQYCGATDHRPLAERSANALATISGGAQ